jgi:hypothetical protein
MAKDIELAILFADVVGSTKLYEQMGDEKARDMVAICIDIMRTATEQHNGTVIKTMGDEVMSTFPTVDDALNAAGQMQQAILAHPELKVDGQPVSIRIGCHFGPVVLENRDIFGAAVHRQPHDQPGQGGTDHHDGHNGGSAFTGMARIGAPDRCRDTQGRSAKWRCSKSVADRGRHQHVACDRDEPARWRNAHAVALPGTRSWWTSSAPTLQSVAPRTMTWW